MNQLDLFTRAGPAFRPSPSDAEMWEAVLHPEGYHRLVQLLEQRHGGNRAAKIADLRTFRAPHIYVGERETAGWSGWMNLLEYRYSHGLTP